MLLSEGQQMRRHVRLLLRLILPRPNAVDDRLGAVFANGFYKPGSILGCLLQHHIIKPASLYFASAFPWSQ